jgi:hypothetical protein
MPDENQRPASPVNRPKQASECIGDFAFIENQDERSTDGLRRAVFEHESWQISVLQKNRIHRQFFKNMSNL